MRWRPVKNPILAPHWLDAWWRPSPGGIKRLVASGPARLSACCFAKLGPERGRLVRFRCMDAMRCAEEIVVEAGGAPAVPRLRGCERGLHADQPHGGPAWNQPAPRLPPAKTAGAMRLGLFLHDSTLHPLNNQRTPT